MANIAISELTSEATSLGDNDYLLVSKNNGTSFTSSKMKGSVLKTEAGGCQFSEDKVKTVCQEAVQQSFENNDVVNQNITMNSVKSNFVDWSQAILISTSLTCQSLPFDALIMWNSLPTTFEINDVDVRTLFYSQKQCYIENGHQLLISPYNTTSCWIIPISYGSGQLEYNTNTIVDWVNDSENRSKIDEYFQTISIWGGNSTTVSQNTEFTSTSQIAGLQCKYWTIKCQPKINMIIGSGGVKIRNKLYKNDYYVSGDYINNSVVVVNANNMTNSGKKVLVKANQYLTMNFMAYSANSTTHIAQTADFFSNIQWSPLTDFNIS